MTSKDAEGLKSSILSLITDLGTILTRPEEVEDLSVAQFFYNRLHPETVMDKALKKLLPHKAAVAARSKKFFMDHMFIFDGLEPDKIAYYKRLITSDKRITPANAEVIWDYLDAFIAYCENYKKID